MEQEQMIFKPLSLRPHWAQFTINQLHWLILCLITFTIYFFSHYAILQTLSLCIGIVLVFYLAFQIMYLARMEYIVTSDQIIFLHGVISHSTDYMELYRIVDYQESRTPVQQLTGLKNILLLSGDRTLPRLRMVGIRGSSRILDEIRARVEYNKKRRGIYEITNRN